MNKIDVPIKYIILPIYNNKENENLNIDILYYMVFRCFLVCERKIYNPDGTSTISYDVVSPYNTFSREINKKEIYPEYDIDGQCYKTRNVMQVFDSFEEAKTCSVVNNNSIISSISPDLLTKYNEVISSYDDYESTYLEATEYMISKNKKRVLK